MNRFSTNLTTFSGLSAGSQSSVFQAMFAIDQLGAFSATYELDVADQSGILGGTGDVLTLNVFGTVVVPEPSSCLLAAMAVAGILAGHTWRRRKRSRR